MCGMREEKCHCRGRAMGTFKGLSSWACLVRPGAAHRVSQGCLSALEVDQSTSECEGGDSKKRQSIL